MTPAEGAEAPDSIFERLTNLPWDKALAAQLAADIDKGILPAAWAWTKTNPLSRRFYGDAPFGYGAVPGR